MKTLDVELYALLRREEIFSWNVKSDLGLWNDIMTLHHTPQSTLKKVHFSNNFPKTKIIWSINDTYVISSYSVTHM